MKEFLKLHLYKIIIVFVVIGLDLLTKEIFYLTDYTILPYLIGTRIVAGLNTGGAFSMLSDSLWLLILITCVFIALICVYDLWAKDKNKLYGVSIALIVGGAIGNFIDRIFLGGVRDFIYFDFWTSFPTFNVADCFLFFGTILMVIYAIFIYKPKENKKETVNVVNKNTIENTNEKDLHSTKKLKTSIENNKKDDKVISDKKIKEKKNK